MLVVSNHSLNPEPHLQTPASVPAQPLELHLGDITQWYKKGE